MSVAREGNLRGDGELSFQPPRLSRHESLLVRLGEYISNLLFPPPSQVLDDPVKLAPESPAVKKVDGQTRGSEWRVLRYLQCS